MLCHRLQWLRVGPAQSVEVLNVTKEVPIGRAYDFSFAKKADGELTQAGWKP